MFPVQQLPENLALSFAGEAAGDAFELSAAQARRFLAAPNVHGKPNGDVVRPRAGVADLRGAPRQRWIIDFPPDMEEREAALYALPFAHLRRRVKPGRSPRCGRWWIHRRPRSAMRAALAKRDRFIAAATISKRRVFVWLPPETLPDRPLTVFARDDDWFFGVLHSRFLDLWARCLGPQLREARPDFRFTPTSCFATFPFPWPPATPLGRLTRAQDEQRTAIAHAARALDGLRVDWLGDRADPTRTLTALYKDPPEWLQRAHAALDETVAGAYGWPAGLPEDEIVTRLLALNRERGTAR